MWWCPDSSRAPTFIAISSLLFNICFTATIKDILNLDTNKLVRVPRDEKLYLDRYGGNTASETVLNNRVIKPEDAADPRDPSGNLGKRCIRCEGGRYPTGSYDPYDRRGYDDRGYRDRYDDRYDDRDRDRYYDRRYDPYERRYEPYDRRYDPYERNSYDRYDRYDRYDQRRDYYDRDRHIGDRDRDRIYDRGIGYDNRGYDYRDYRDRDYYRPASHYDDRDDLSSRGYGGRPSYYGSGGGYWGGGYASSWNYGGGKDDYRDRYGDDRYRYRDPYDGYRATSYLYGRPSTAPISNTTTNPSNSGITDSPGSSG